MNVCATRKAAKILGVSTSRLVRAIWDEQFKSPNKGPGGNYLWTRQDVNRASMVLLSRPYEGHWPV